MPIIKVGERNVHYQEINRGAPQTVVLVHGMLGNLAVYYFRIAPVLARDFHVVMYDLKSHGMSESAAEGYDLETMAGDLLGLMDALQLGVVHLAGYSFGGLVVLKAAMRFPGKFVKLVVIEGPDPSDEEPIRVMTAYNKDAFDEYITEYMDTSGKRMGQRQLDRHHRMYAYIFQQTTMRADMRREATFFSGEEIRHIPHDSLLIYGKQSGCVAAGQLLVRKLKHARLLLVEGDHNVPVQQPGVIADSLRQFFNDSL
jgi:pimeloyl-ACP methyl ester carboxylesterase